VWPPFDADDRNRAVRNPATTAELLEVIRITAWFCRRLNDTELHPLMTS
jgi:hypothetical protein